MNSYHALEFSLDNTKIKVILEFSLNTDLIGEYGLSNKEYYHDNFPHHTDEEKHILSHATWIIQELLSSTKKDPENINTLKKSLELDYSHYIEFLEYRESENLEFIKQFTELMFAFDLENTVIDKISEYKETYDAEPSEYKSMRALAMDKLFIKAGDKYLFLKNDIQAAIKLYNLALLDWGEEIYIDSLDDDLILTINEKQVFKRTVSILKQLSTGSLLSKKDDLKTITSEEFEKAYKIYESIYLSSNEALDNQNIVTKTNNFFIEIDKLYNFETPPSDELRILQSMIQQIYKMTLIPVLYQLSKENSSTRLSYKDRILEKLKYLNNTDFQILLQLDYKDYDKLFLYIQTIVLAKCILYELMAQEKIPPSAYYTSLETFGFMLSSERKEQLGKPAIMNISYMNDPNEGKSFKHLIYGAQYTKNSTAERKNISIPYVFLKCFTSQIDYLPMWEMYGNHAQGCCLVVDWQKTFFENKNISKSLFQVCYINKSEKGYDIRKSDNPQIRNTERIKTCIRELKKLAAQLNASEQTTFEKLLGELPYLFKDNSYSYEQEVRILYLFSKPNKNFKHTDNEIPKLFIIPDFYLQIKEIILGPKVSDIADRIPYLQEQIELMCEKTRTSIPKITISNIDYR